MQTIPWEEYPHLTAHRDQHMEDGAHREVNAFEVGLDLILDGLRERPARPRVVVRAQRGTSRSVAARASGETIDGTMVA